MKRRSIVVLALAVALAATITAGSPASGATSMAKPRTGAWKFHDADGGFSIVPGRGKDRGKQFLTGVHSRTQNFVGCPEKPEPITVAGRFPLKVVTLSQIYPVWAVGKPGTETRYSDGNSGLISIPAKVEVGGKPVPGGGIKMEFSYEDPTAFSLLIIEYKVGKNVEPCVTYSELASHA